MKVLITGATGLLGTHLIRSLPKDIQAFGTVHQYKKTIEQKNVTYIPLDIQNEKEVEATFRQYEPDIVIHTAAHTSVDFCESNKDETHKTNVLGTQYIINAIKI